MILKINGKKRSISCAEEFEILYTEELIPQDELIPHSLKCRLHLWLPSFQRVQDEKREKTDNSGETLKPVSAR